jgi:REP element-mobilizing transposase RayT
MPQGLHRFYGAGDLHFITFSCYRRRPFLTNAAHCDRLLTILERVRRRYRLVVVGYVVMPEHVHLLVSEPQRGTLSTVVQALKLGFVRSLVCADPKSRKIGETRGTHVGTDLIPKRYWQARFYDFNVWTERKPGAPGLAGFARPGGGGMCGARFLEPSFEFVFGLRASGISLPPRSRKPGETWGTQFRPLFLNWLFMFIHHIRFFLKSLVWAHASGSTPLLWRG